MKDISNKRVSKVLAEANSINTRDPRDPYSVTYTQKFKDLLRKLELDVHSFDVTLVNFNDGSGFEYEDQGGLLTVDLQKDGSWRWESVDFGEKTSKGSYAVEKEKGDGGWNALMDSLFSSDLSIFVATPYTAADFKDGEAINESMASAKRNRMKEERVKPIGRMARPKELHTYTFLVCDGNGAASRGEDVDGYSERTVTAPSLKKALQMIWKYLTFSSNFKEFCEDYLDAEDEDPRTWTEDELLDYLDEQDITGGEPWLEAYKIDGKMIREPEYIYEILDNYDGDNIQDVVYFHNANPADWGIDFSEYEYDDEDEEDEDFDESSKVKDNRIQERKVRTPAPSSIKRIFNGDPDYFKKASQIIFDLFLDGWDVQAYENTSEALLGIRYMLPLVMNRRASKEEKDIIMKALGDTEIGEGVFKRGRY